MPAPADLSEAITGRISSDEVTAVLRDLVRAASPNPPGDERQAAAAAGRWLEEAGCHSFEEVEELPGRTNLLATWGPADAERTLVFNGHLDVVPVGDPDEWTHPPFEATVDDGKVHGRGTADMKSGIASMIEALLALGRLGFAPAGRLVFHLVADEEAAGVHGTGFLLNEGRLKGDAAIVGEPTSLMIGLGERGTLWADIVARGRAAHGSVPHHGVSAIEKLAKVVLALHNRGFEGHNALLGSPSLNVGVFEGGTKVNIVADRARIAIDRRTIPGETLEAVLGELDGILGELRSADPEIDLEIEVVQFAEPSLIDKGSPVVEQMARSVQAMLGGPPDYYGSPGVTDARFYRNQAGIPTVVFGPGPMALAHTVDEFVEIADLTAGAGVYAHFVSSYLG